MYPDSIGDISAIGEISKEEAFDQMFCDSLYFDSILPALRSTGHYTYFPGMTCFDNGRDTEINLPLADNQFFWVDYNAFNGVSYAYAVSTFDRGYNISSGRQGLQKKTNKKQDNINRLMPTKIEKLDNKHKVDQIDSLDMMKKIDRIDQIDQIDPIEKMNS